MINRDQYDWEGSEKIWTGSYHTADDIIQMFTAVFRLIFMPQNFIFKHQTIISDFKILTGFFKVMLELSYSVLKN